MLIQAMTIKLMTLAMSAGTIQPPADQNPSPPPQAERGQPRPDDRGPSGPPPRRERAPRQDGPRDGAGDGPMNDDRQRNTPRGVRGPEQEQSDPGPRQTPMDGRNIRSNRGPNAKPEARPDGQQRRMKNRDGRRAGRGQGQMDRNPEGQRQFDQGPDMRLPDMRDQNRRGPDMRGRDMRGHGRRGPHAKGPHAGRQPMPPQGRDGRAEFQPRRGPEANGPNINQPRGQFHGQAVPMGRGQRMQGPGGPQRMPKDFRDGPRFYGPQQHRAPMPPMHGQTTRRRDR